jgi:hypothetical protein
MSRFVQLGFGIGLRSVHYPTILRQWPAIDWFEIISENYIDSRGRPRYVLDQIAERYPIVMHGVSMSIGSTDPIDRDYVGKLKTLADQIGARWISDHLCWTGVLGRNSHDLLPLPLTEETLTHVVARIKLVQEILERPLYLENPSSYVTFQHSTMDEPEFLTAMTQLSGCGLLLDVNNIYVTCTNHDLDPYDYLRRVPHQRVIQFHLAGHATYPTHIIDTHDHPVIDEVWKLYLEAHRLTGGASTLVEWDAQIPPFEVVHAEVLKAKRLVNGEQVETNPAADQRSLDPAAAEPLASPHPLHHIHAEVE